MDATNVIKILKKRIKFIVTIIFIIFLLSLFKVLFFPYYEASTTIMIGHPKIYPTSIEEDRLPLSDYTSYVRSHASLIESRPIIKKVIGDLQIIGQQLKWETKEEHLERTIKKFQKRYVSVKIHPMSPFIKITVRYKDAKMARDIANKIVQVYKDWSLDFLRKEVDQIAKFTEEEFNKAESKLEESENKLKKYQQDNEIASLTEQRQILLERLAAFKTEYAHAKIREEEILASLKETDKQLLEQKTQIKTSVAVNRNPLIGELRVELITLETELNRTLELYTEKSPQAIYRRKRIAELKKEISDIIENIEDAEIANISPIYLELLERSTGLKTELASIKSKLDSLSSLIKEYKNKLNDIPRMQLTLSRLERQVDIDQDIYVMLVEKKEMIDLLKAKENIDNIKVASYAIVPNKPKEGLLFVILNTFIGMIVVSIAAIILESRQFF